mgnify:CR=1 FL=1
MTTEINKENITDLASFIDAENMPERMAALTDSQPQPLSEPAVPVEEPAPAEGPQLLSENPDRIASRRQQERLKKVVVGELFHGRLTSWELKEARNGNLFIRVECELECNGWHMTHTRFLPKSALDSTEGIAAARDKILADFGFNFEKQQFEGVRLFEIGTYPGKDGKEHLKVARLYADTADYNNFLKWKWARDHQPKKQWKVTHAPLPE